MNLEFSTSETEFWDLNGPTFKLLSLASTFLGVCEGLSELPGGPFDSDLPIINPNLNWLESQATEKTGRIYIHYTCNYLYQFNQIK